METEKWVFLGTSRVLSGNFILILQFFWKFFWISIFVYVGVCGWSGVGKEKLNLMTGGGGDKDKSITRSERLTLSRA